MGTAQVGKLARSLYRKTGGDLTNTARALAFKAYREGSLDNISLLLTKIDRATATQSPFYRSFVVEHDGTQAEGKASRKG